MLLMGDGIDAGVWNVSCPKDPDAGAILEAALDVFSAQGFRGATLDQIAEVAGLSKPNLLYYFASKEAIHVELLSGLMDTWLDPLRLSHTRRDELATLAAYEALLTRLLAGLSADTLTAACELAESAEAIKGFGVVRQAHAAPVLARWQAFSGFSELAGFSASGSPGRRRA
jgi:AcrR family transcriptional regulator